MKGARNGREPCAGGISVAIKGIPSPLLYGGPGRINFLARLKSQGKSHRPGFLSATLPPLTESAPLVGDCVKRIPAKTRVWRLGKPTQVPGTLESGVPPSERMIAPAGTAAQNSENVCPLAVGEVLFGMRMSMECHGCHPGLSEDFVATANKFAFMAMGSCSSRPENNSENLCPPPIGAELPGK
jgi:hypothetical protein